MPLYNHSEDLDIYLNRFELTCSALKISKDLWVLALIKSLKGQALEVHERLRAEDAQDYDKLKIELLKRFRLTEEGYRKKFKEAVREKDETTVQFGDRLTRYLEKWLQMSGFKETYAGLRELIIRDQFFCKCDDETRCFIKQKGKLNLEDTLTQAQYFLESKDSMEREWLPGQWKQKESFKDYKGVDRNNATKPKEMPNEQKETRNFQPKGAYQNSWNERKQNFNPNKAQPRKGCYICSSSDHKAYECRQRHGGEQTYISAMIHCLEERSEKKEEGDEIVEMLALEVSDSNAEIQKDDDSYADFIDIVKVNGKEVQALYDTGATKPALRRELVKKDQYIDKSVLCTFPNGVKERYPIAKVEIDGEHYKGMVEVMVMPNLLKDTILTPRQYARPVKTKALSTQTNNTIVAEEIKSIPTEEKSKAVKIENEDDEVHEAKIATYELKSKSGEKKTRGVKPLKWPVLTEENHKMATVETVVNDRGIGGDEEVLERFSNKPKETNRDYFARIGKVNGREIKCWCNPGLTKMLIQPGLILQQQYTGRYRWYAVNGRIRRRYRTAKIIFAGRGYYFEEEVLEVPGLKKEFIYTSAVLSRIRRSEQRICRSEPEKKAPKERVIPENRCLRGRNDETNARKVVHNRNKRTSFNCESPKRNLQSRRSECSNWRTKMADEKNCWEDPECSGDEMESSHAEL